MPLYEGKHNAVNQIEVGEDVVRSVVNGTEATIARIAQIAEAALAKGKAVALDGWYGVDFVQIVAALREELQRNGRDAEFIDAKDLVIASEMLTAYKKKFLTDDPGFGWVNTGCKISDIFEPEAVERLKKRLEASPAVVYGYGCATKELADCFSDIIYFDKTHQTLMWQMWDGKLVPFGSSMPKTGYEWKEYYYCDYYLLLSNKEYLFGKADYYVQASYFDDMKLMPTESYHQIASTLLKYPIKEVEIYQPGPWGAYRYRDLWDIEGLKCNAWNELAGVDLGLLVDIGQGVVLNMPFANLMYYGERLVGKEINEKYPYLFPLQAWLDDGWFPGPQPAERTSMPIHNHPGTDYVKRHFNEPLGRYETYYIVEAYEGANTWMGLRKDADLEEWERKCRESQNLKVIENWRDYVANWESRVGDLYLIPPGTDHGHGGNQMVLELDTCPSVAGAEYSFFSYDFARHSWDDTTKTMTGKPMKMHLEHSFDNDKWRREDYVEEKLRSRPSVVCWTKEYYLERYASLPEMPFEIERLFFSARGEYGTEGKTPHIVTLTAGKNAVIRSKSQPKLQTTINYLQAAVIPAEFGQYELLADGSGQHTAVILRWKY